MAAPAFLRVVERPGNLIAVVCASTPESSPRLIPETLRARCCGSEGIRVVLLFCGVNCVLFVSDLTGHRPLGGATWEGHFFLLMGD